MSSHFSVIYQEFDAALICSLFVANFFGPLASLSGVFSFSVSLWPPIEFAFIAFIVGAAACGRSAYCEWLDVA